MKKDSPARILVVDDHKGLLANLACALESEGYQVRTGTSGEEGVAIARQFQPAVVVCDMHMPHGDGRSVLTALRQEERLGLSQFILMTGDREKTTQRVGMDFGADDYLAKPFTIAEFLQCVRTRLRRSEAYRRAEERSLVHLRETITQSLPHEVFTPLTGILGFAEVLREEIGKVTPVEAGKMVAQIHSSAERLNRTLKNYLRILDIMNHPVPVHSPGAALRPAELASTLTRTATAVAAKYDRVADLRLDCGALGLPLTKEDLSVVIVELMDNACKYSNPGTPLELRLQATGLGLALAVTDRGRGMSAEQIAHIGAFRQFDRQKYEQQGLGLGLTLTQYLVEQSGGDFRLESSPGAGTAVTATWPRPSP